MSLLQNFLIPILVNAVPIAGCTIGGWNSATALVVYWAGNVIGSILIALRIFLHRRLTHKHGHYRAQLNVKTTARSGTRSRNVNTTFLAEFLITSLVFTAAHGFFLGLLLVVMKAPIDINAVITGMSLVAAFQVISFVGDVIGLKTRPFAWIRRVSQFALGRVILVHFAIIAGMLLAVLLSNNAAFVVPFAVLKLLSDVSNGIGMGMKDDHTAPAWFINLMNKIKPSKKPGDDFGTYLVKEREREEAEATADEVVIRVETRRGTPS